MNDLIYYQKVV